MEKEFEKVFEEHKTCDCNRCVCKKCGSREMIIETRTKRLQAPNNYYLYDAIICKKCKAFTTEKVAEIDKGYNPKADNEDEKKYKDGLKNKSVKQNYNNNEIDVSKIPF